MTVNKSHKLLVRARMAATGKPYTAAARDVEVITEIMGEQDCDYAVAEGEYDDPRNQLLCRDCGWTMGMICPECAKGCGCEWRCTGWRHHEFAHEDQDAYENAGVDYCMGCGAEDEEFCDC